MGPPLPLAMRVPFAQLLPLHLPPPVPISGRPLPPRALRSCPCTPLLRASARLLAPPDPVPTTRRCSCGILIVAAVAHWGGRAACARGIR